MIILQGHATQVDRDGVLDPHDSKYSWAWDPEECRLYCGARYDAEWWWYSHWTGFERTPERIALWIALTLEA